MSETLSDKALSFFKWLKIVATGVLIVCSSVGGVGPVVTILPAWLLQTCVILTAIAGGLATFASGQLPNKEQTKNDSIPTSKEAK